MIVTWQVALRISLLIVLTTIAQFTLFSELSILGSSPNLLPVLAVALGLLGGGVLGAVCGFAIGLLGDSLLLQTLGVSSIVLLTIGYLGGRWRESFDITSSLVPPLLCGGLSLFGAAMFTAIQLMLGVESPVSLLVLREVLVQGLLATLLAIPFYPLCRRFLRSALVEDTGRRRRASLVPIRGA